MTIEQKQRIAELRAKGFSCAKIGEMLGISKNTVKTYCHRNNLSASSGSKVNNTSVCRECGKTLAQTDKQKPKIFCSKECRMKWWHAHPEQVKRNALYSFRCTGCGKSFTSYGNKRRKYCSHECYINTRFKGGDRDE